MAFPLVEAGKSAAKRVANEANAMRTDAIVDIWFASSSVMQSAAEVLIYVTE